MGDVVNGKYPLSLSIWFWLPERQDILSFVPIVKENFILSALPQPSRVDFGVFIRPFRMEAWNALAFIMLLDMSLLAIAYKSSVACNAKGGLQIVRLVSWLAFVVINAYFGGALTMFFTSEITLPFESLRDVLQRSPDWTLLSLDGLDAVFNLPASQVNQFLQTIYRVCKK